MTIESAMKYKKAIDNTTRKKKKEKSEKSVRESAQGTAITR